MGATHAACMAELGYEVLGLDVDAEKFLRASRAQRQVQHTELFFDPVNVDFVVIVHLEKQAIGDVVLPYRGRLASYFSADLVVGEIFLLN